MRINLSLLKTVCFLSVFLYTIKGSPNLGFLFFIFVKIDDVLRSISSVKSTDTSKTRRAEHPDGSVLSVREQGARKRNDVLRSISAFYSVRRATTGSFFAAARDGIIPLMSVNEMLIAIKINAVGTGNTALKFAIPVKACKIALIGIQSR